MKRTKSYKAQWSGRIVDKEFEDLVFEELVVRKAKVDRVRFKNVHFKNCYLGFHSHYSNSDFIDCRFYGKYSSLGSSAQFRNCRFENCQFIGMDLFTGQHFYGCQFSGKMKNPILNDKHPKISNFETVFSDCDLTEMIFENVSHYGKDVFQNCLLPNSGIRLFDNTNNRLVRRAEEICQTLNAEERLKPEIIFKSDLKKGQNPFILDILFLESFFDTDASKKVFEEIVKGHELKEQANRDIISKRLAERKPSLETKNTAKQVFKSLFRRK